MHLSYDFRSFKPHFNESTMFTGGKQARKLKEEFRHHFRNITRIMDCVGCEKCKVWGKLQTQGLGTALKILFSGPFDQTDPTAFDLASMKRMRFQLTRNEIVALFNAFGRYLMITIKKKKRRDNKVHSSIVIAFLPFVD